MFFRVLSDGFRVSTLKHCKQDVGAITKSADSLEKKKKWFEQNFRIFSSLHAFTTWERKELLVEEEKSSTTLATMTTEQKERSTQSTPGTTLSTMRKINVCVATLADPYSVSTWYWLLPSFCSSWRSRKSFTWLWEANAWWRWRYVSIVTALELDLCCQIPLDLTPLTTFLN